MPGKNVVVKSSVLGRQGREYMYTESDSEPPDPPWSKYTYDSSVSSRIWDNTPGYKTLTRAQRKNLAPRGFTTSISSLSGYFSGSSSWEFGGHSDVLGDQFSRLVWDLPIASLNFGHGAIGSELVTRDDLYLSARAQLQQNRSWNAPLFLAEGHKTASMVVGAAEKIVHGLRAARRLDVKELNKLFPMSSRKSTSQTASGLWLERKYGWLPLLRDVHDSVSAMDENLSRRRSPSVVSTVHVSKSRVENSQRDFDLQGSPRILGHGNLQIRHTRRLTLRYRISDLSAYTAASFGLTNPASLAWELIPFSFVADWFVPVGDYLSTLDAGIGIEILTGFQSSKYVEEAMVTSATSNDFNGRCSCSGVHSLIVVSREKLDSLPSVVPTSLTVRPKLGSERLVTAVALMRQLVR